MTGRDDHHREMDELLSPEQIESILAGRVVDDPLGNEVGQVVAGLRSLLAEPDPSLAARHVTAMTEAAASLATAPARRSLRDRLAIPRPRWAVAASLAGALSLTGGLAAAGALPGPAQNAVASLASHVGIHLRDAADLHAGESGDNHGSDVSGVARDRSTSGCEHGEAVSDAARDDASSTSSSTTSTTDDRRCATAGDGDRKPATTVTTAGDGHHRRGRDCSSEHPCTGTTVSGDGGDDDTTVTTEDDEPGDVSGRDEHGGDSGGSGGGSTSTTATSTTTNTTP